MNEIEKLPTEQVLRKYGRFLGYSLENNYADVVRFKNKNYVLLDSFHNGKLSYIVDRYRARVGLLTNGFSEIDGTPL